MKFISLFAGIGGFDLALERLGHECVYVNDIDKYCKLVYDKHFKTKLDLRDIRTVGESELPDFDILCGGFPCQSFSIAGKRRGFEDTRGTLFFEIARIVKAKRPTYLFLENVKGLLSHDNGRTFETILWAIDELGYDVQWQVCNSKNFGVPQNRERVFIIGHLRGTARPEVFPLRGDNPEADEKFASTTIDANYWKGIDNHGQRTAIIQLNHPSHSNDRFYGTDGISPTLNTMQGGNRQPKIITGSPVYKEGKRSVEYHTSDIAPTIRATQYKSGDNQPKVMTVAERGRYNAEGKIEQQLEPRFDGLTNTLTGVEKDNRIAILRKVRTEYGKQVRKDYEAGRINAMRKDIQQYEPRTDGISNTLSTVEKDNYLQQDMQIRRLTPIECERLQGFPDNWTAEGVNGEGQTVSISDTQRYKMCGNAISVPVVYYIAQKLVL